MKVFVKYVEDGWVNVYIKRTRQSEGRSVDLRRLPRGELEETLGHELDLISHPPLSDAPTG